MMQAAPQDQAIESMQSLIPQNYSWVPVMHANAKGNAIASYLHHPSLQHACDAVSPYTPITSVLAQIVCSTPISSLLSC